MRKIKLLDEESRITSLYEYGFTYHIEPDNTIIYQVFNPMVTILHRELPTIKHITQDIPEEKPKVNKINIKKLLELYQQSIKTMNIYDLHNYKTNEYAKR